MESNVQSRVRGAGVGWRHAEAPFIPEAVLIEMHKDTDPGAAESTNLAFWSYSSQEEHPEEPSFPPPNPSHTKRD